MRVNKLVKVLMELHPYGVEHDQFSPTLTPDFKWDWFWVEANVVTNLHEQSIGISTEHTLYVWVLPSPILSTVHV